MDIHKHNYLQHSPLNIHDLLIRIKGRFIKNLARKTQWDKTMAKGKRVQRVSPPHYNITKGLLIDEFQFDKPSSQMLQLAMPP